MSPAVTSPVHRTRRLAPAVAVLAVSAALVGASTAVAVADPATSAASSTPAGRYYAISPTRVLDTRTSGGPLHHGGTRVVDLSRAFSGSASAAVINLTVVSPTGAGYLTAFPAGTRQPLASSLNFGRGETRANSVTVAVGQGDQQNDLAIGAYVQGNGSAQVVVDVVGWYGNGGGAAGSSYQPLAAPVRLFDTRKSIGGLTTTYPKNIGIVSLDYGSPAINKTITAAVMNITVTGTRGGGNLTIWNGLGAPPVVSTLNFVAGQTVANLAVVPVRCADPTCKTVTFSIKNSYSPYTQVIGDIAGIYATPSAAGLLYKPVAPTRVTDTRERMPYGRLGTGASGVTDVNSVVVPGTRALNVNLTGVNPLMTTYLTISPAATAVPVVSNLNMTRGTVAANAAQVRTVGGRFNTTNYLGWTDVVIDLEGMFLTDTAFTSAVSAKTATSSVVSGSIS